MRCCELAKGPGRLLGRACGAALLAAQASRGKRGRRAGGELATGDDVAAQAALAQPRAPLRSPSAPLQRMAKRKAAEAAAEARRGAEADSDEGAAAAAGTAAGGAEVAAQQPLAVELEGVWRHIGRGLRLPADADAAECQAALLRWAGFEWSSDGALTVKPPGFNPSPLALHLLPVDVATAVLLLLPVHDRLHCAGVSRAWRTLARLPAAWARISWPFSDRYMHSHSRGLGEILVASLSRLAFARHGRSFVALLPDVARLDIHAYARSPNEDDWLAAVARCPSLQELRFLAFDGPTTVLCGEEMGASPGALLAVLQAAPALRVLDAHVELRQNKRGNVNLAKVEQLRTLLAHPRANVATLSVRVPATVVDAAYHKALGDVLESAEAASLRSIHFSRRSGPLAYFLAGALGRSARIQVRLEMSFPCGVQRRCAALTFALRSRSTCILGRTSSAAVMSGATLSWTRALSLGKLWRVCSKRTVPCCGLARPRSRSAALTTA